MTQTKERNQPRTGDRKEPEARTNIRLFWSAGRHFKFSLLFFFQRGPTDEKWNEAFVSESLGLSVNSGVARSSVIATNLRQAGK